MTIYEKLKQDHETVRALLGQLLALPDDSDAHFDLVDRIHDELIPHSRAEEAVFYNSIRLMVRERGDDKRKVMQGFKEHLEAEMLLRSMRMKERTRMDWKKTAYKLQEALEHHIREEETTLFSLAREVIDPEDTEKLGMAFERLKAESREDGFVGNALDMVRNLMPPKLSPALKLERERESDERRAG